MCNVKVVADLPTRLYGPFLTLFIFALFTVTAAQTHGELPLQPHTADR